MVFHFTNPWDMAKLDKVKEEIGWIKAVFSIVLVTDLSLIAWLIQHFDTDGKRAISWGCLVLILLLSTAWIFTNQWIYRKINSLEDL